MANSMWQLKNKTIIHMKASPLRSFDFKGKVTKGHE
jgi:hypothetical protein